MCGRGSLVLWTISVISFSPSHHDCHRRRYLRWIASLTGVDEGGLLAETSPELETFQRPR